METRVTPGPKVYIPQMADHAFAFAGAMRSLGIEAEVLPRPDDRSMALGLSLCRGRECLPCFFCVGDIVAKCRELGPAVKDAIFFMPTGPGPCRFGQYVTLQKQIVSELGFPEARFVSPTHVDSYSLFGAKPLTLRKRAWHAFVAIDILTRVLHEHRPYEIVPGSADDTYRACLARIVKSAEAGCGKQLVDAMEWTADRFAQLPVQRTTSRPVIGVIGEIYMVLNTRANLDIVRAVEKAGGDVIQGTFSDYLHYVDWHRKDVAFRFGKRKDFWKGVLTDRYQYFWERRLFAPLQRVLRFPPETDVKTVMKRLSLLYEPALGTEAVLTMARALDLYRHGVSGFINVMPFSCMPGAVVAAMAPKLRESMKGIPWLDIPFDGQKDTNIKTRLEAFMHQVFQFHRRSGSVFTKSGANRPVVMT